MAYDLSGVISLSCPQDVALVELSGSDSDSTDVEETSDSEESDSDEEVTEENLKLPGDKDMKKKANIQVVEQQRE